MLSRRFILISICFLSFFCGCEKVSQPKSVSSTKTLDLEYAKHIEVACYLVNREQLGEIFSQTEANITQLPNNKLCRNDVYLLVRCKNKGNLEACGILHCLIPNRGSPIPFDISELTPHTTSFHDYVIYIRYGVSQRDRTSPKIQYQWDSLYTVRR